MHMLPPAPMALLTGTAGPDAKCSLSSRTTLVLFALLAHAPVAGASWDRSSFSSSEATHLRPVFVSSHRGNLALLEANYREWAEDTPQPKSQCSEDADCSFHARCSSSTGKCTVVPLGTMPSVDILMCLLAFVIAGFSLAAGVGGGGLYVPLLMFILSFDARVATALSQAMLFGGAFAAFVYNIQMSHPSRPERPLINFELALLMAPALMGGAQVGATLHALAPSVATLLLLLLVLGDAARKGVRSAQNISAKEEKEKIKADEPGAEASVTQQVDENSELVWQHSKSAGKRLLLVWLLCIALVATKGLLFEMCSPMWWILTAGSALLLSGLSWMFAGTLSVQEPVDDDDIDFRKDAFPLVKMSVIAGAIAALCGIGGGMVMGPILVELKVPPPISSATTATTLVVLSTSTLLIYVIRGQAPPDYALLLSCFTMLGAAVGKVLCGWWVRRTGKQSVIVWTLVGVTVCSMALLGLEGVLTFVRDPWGSLAFRSFCQGHIHHTVPATD